MGIKVVANALGFYGGKLRPAGTAFEVSKESELGSWMDRAEEDKPESPFKGKKVKPKFIAPEPVVEDQPVEEAEE